MNSIEKLAHDLRALGAVGSDYPITFHGRFGGDTIPQAAEMLDVVPDMLAALRQIVEESDNVLLFSPPSKTNAARTIAAKARRIALDAIAKAEALNSN